MGKLVSAIHCVRVNRRKLLLLRTNHNFCLAGFENLAREISARWKKVTAEEKAVYLELAKKDKERYTKQMDEWRAALEEECAQLSDETPPEVPRRTRTATARVVSRSETPEAMSHDQPSEEIPQVRMEQATANPVVLVNSEGSFLNVPLPTSEWLVMDDITLDFWDINDPETVESAMVPDSVPATDASAAVFNNLVEPQQVLGVPQVQLPDGSAERNSMAELANKLDQDCQDFLISTFA